MREEIIEAMARTLFVLAYADFIERSEDDDNEESDEDLSGLPRARGGEDWCDVAPATSGAALATAERAVMALERLNGCSLETIFARATAACVGATPRKCRSRHDPEHFGSDLGMMLAQTGVSWFDDHAMFPLRVPSVEFHILCRADLTAAEDEQLATIDERFV